QRNSQANRLSTCRRPTQLLSLQHFDLPACVEMIRASDPRHWAELCAAFDTLVELDADARAERLAAIGASDPAAQRALEQLLEADASAGDRLGRIEGIFGGADPS